MGECSSWGNFGWKVHVLAVIWGGCTLGKASMPSVRSGLHFEVPWLNCQLKMCVQQWRI